MSISEAEGEKKKSCLELMYCDVVFDYSVLCFISIVSSVIIQIYVCNAMNLNFYIASKIQARSVIKAR